MFQRHVFFKRLQINAFVSTWTDCERTLNVSIRKINFHVLVMFYQRIDAKLFFHQTAPERRMTR